MAVTLPYPSLSSGAVVSHDELNQNFSTLANKFGTIDNSDVKSGAGISIDKLSASYEYMVVKLSGALSGSGYVDYCPIYNDGKGAWTVAGVSYITADAGSADAAFRVQFGYPTDASTTFNVTDNITAATSITATDGNYRHGTVSVTDTSIEATTNNEVLALNITTTQASAGTVYVSVMLKRQIKT